MTLVCLNWPKSIRKRGTDTFLSFCLYDGFFLILPFHASYGKGTRYAKDLFIILHVSFLVAELLDWVTEVQSMEHLTIIDKNALLRILVLWRDRISWFLFLFKIEVIFTFNRFTFLNNCLNTTRIAWIKLTKFLNSVSER